MIRLIVALDEQRGMAKAGVQPWLIPDDEANFGQLTKSYGGVVLMGQKTFEVIGHPLPERRNYVLTREMRTGDGVIYIQDLDEFIGSQPDVWVIGGASVYDQTLALADELYVTHIKANFGCDQFFPEFAHSFDLKSESELHTQNGFIYTHATYGKL